MDRWRRDQGQSTALVISMLFVLILFVAVVADVGQAVNRKIALQVIADTGAFTGASKMAAQVNQLAHWNKVLQEVWAIFSWPMALGGALAFDGYGGWFWPGCEIADPIEAAYSFVWSTVSYTTFNPVNVLSAPLPFGEARRVSNYNALELFPGEQDQLEYREWALDLGILPSRPVWTLVETDQVDSGWPAAVPWALAPARPTVVYTCAYDTSFGLVWDVRWRQYSHWYRKADPKVSYFVWIVRLKNEKVRALLFDSLFGGRVIPEMEAVAVAKAVGGSIEDGDSAYIAKMVPVSKVMLVPVAYDNLYDLRLRPVVH